MPDTIWQPDLAGYDGPKYLALAHFLREAVRSGSLPEGQKLPPVRDLAWRLGITPGTVARAYQIVTQEGLLSAVVGRGTFVAARTAKLGPNQALISDPVVAGGETVPLIDMRIPEMPDVGQGRAISAIMHKLADKVGRDYLGYPFLHRDTALRDAVADWLSGNEIGPFGAADIALTNGGQNAIHTVLQCCLRGDRPRIFVEELAYPGYRYAARLNRAEVVPVAMDDEGMRADALDAACRRQGGRVVCITPEAQNPTTIRMSPQRRAEIVAVARDHDLQIIEDDCYSVRGDPLPALRALASDRTWYISSLSKSIAAGLRFGMIVCPTGRGEAGRMAAQHSFFGLARPVSDIVQELLLSGEAVALRDRVNAVFARRLEMTLNILGRYDVAWQRGLSFVWVRLPLGWRASTFARRAEAEGVLVRSADEYTVVDGHAPNAIRIAFAGGLSEAAFAEGLNRLASLLANPPGDLSI
ncbi:MAG: PLP-dependent aminotransferase family protein [Rhodobacteraceae bacterium]|nr:PLP-dependent aminotransferase family protein [Paracoccaceae bacterium]